MRLHALRAAQSSWRKSITLSDSSGGMPGWTGEEGVRGKVTSTMTAMTLVSSGENQIVGGCSGGSVLTGVYYEDEIGAEAKGTLR